MVKFVQTKKNRILLFFLIITLPFLFGIAYLTGFNRVYAAITFDNKSQGSSPIKNGTSNSVTWSHTVGNNTNRILIVGFNTLHSSNALPQNVKYNGLNLTMLTSQNCTFCTASLWYLVNPPVGTYNITASLPSPPLAGNTAISGGAASYYNVNIDTPFAGFNSTSSTLSNPTTINTSLSLSDTTTSDVVVDVVGGGSNCNGPGTITAGSGQTKQWSPYVYNNIDSCFFSAGSTKPGAAGSTTMTWTITRTGSGPFGWAAIAARLALPVAPTTAPTTTAPTPAGNNTINGYVYIDANKNGQKDTGETGYAGATVRMTNQSSGATTNLQTDSTGRYAIQVGTGTFCMSLPTPPSGYSSTDTQPAPCDIITGSNNVLSHHFGIAPIASACDSQPAEIMLSVDRSSSMTSNQTSMKTAVKNFIDEMAGGGQKRIGLASYNTTGTLNSPLTFNYASVKTALDGLSFGDSSYGQPEAITIANQQLSGGRANTKRFHIHITDRDNSGAVDEAQAGWTNYKAILYIVDFDDGDFPAVDFNPVISQSNGKYYSITTGTFDQLLKNAATDICTKLPAPPTTTFTISGSVFVDNNANGIKDTTDSNDANTPLISISPNAGSITTNTNGAYTITNLPAGTYVVSYNSLPTGFHMTSPVNGPPPSYKIIVGPSCSTNDAAGASCQ